MTGEERGRGQDEFLRPELTAWFSALLLLIVLVGALGYAVGCLIIAPMFLGEGFARHCLGAVLALASLLWAVGRQHVQLAIRAFWAELGVYLALLCQVAFVAVLAYLAGYFFSGSLLSAGLARHCVAAATVVASLYWGRKWWRAWRHTGEADDLYQESKDGVREKYGRDLAAEGLRDQLLSVLEQVRHGRPRVFPLALGTTARFLPVAWCGSGGRPTGSGMFDIRRSSLGCRSGHAGALVIHRGQSSLGRMQTVWAACNRPPCQSPHARGVEGKRLGLGPPRFRVRGDLSRSPNTERDGGRPQTAGHQ